MIKIGTWNAGDSKYTRDREEEVNVNKITKLFADVDILVITEISNLRFIGIIKKHIINLQNYWIVKQGYNYTVIWWNAKIITLNLPEMVEIYNDIEIEFKILITTQRQSQISFYLTDTFKRINVIIVHLRKNSFPKDLIESMRLLNMNDSFLCIGDFNIVPVVLMTHLSDVSKQKNTRFGLLLDRKDPPTSNGNHIIDNIIYNMNKLKVETKKVYSQIIISDHRPVIGSFTLIDEVVSKIKRDVFIDVLFKFK